MLVPLLTLFAGFGISRVASYLRDYRPENRGFVDFVPSFLIADHSAPAVILNKDGSFSACYRFLGPDRASSTDEGLAALTRQFSAAFWPLVDSWTFHLDLVRRPAPSYPGEGAFPDSVTRFLDNQRREAYLASGALYETHYFLTATYRPPREIYQHTLLKLQQGVQENRRTWEASLLFFKDQLAALEARLSAHLRLRPQDATQFLTHLKTCLAGSFQTLRDPGPGVYLDQVLATTTLTTGWEPRLDDQQLSPVSIYHLPGSILPADLDALNDLPFPFRFSIRFSPLGTLAAQKVMDLYTQAFFMSQKSLKDLMTTKDRGADDPFRDRHAAAMLSDVADALAANQGGPHRFCYLTATLLLPGPTREIARDRATSVEKLLGDRGYAVRLETYNATAAWHGTIPGECSANLRAPLVHMLPMAALAPLTSLWPGLERHPCRFYSQDPPAPPLLVGRTEGSTPFRLHLHSGDLGHTVVVGPPGAGKSTLLTALAAAHLRYPESRVYFFDRDLSALLFATAAGAQHYNLGDGSVAFQPLRYIDTPAQRAAALTWLEALAALQIDRLTTTHTQQLVRALDDLAELPPELRTLEDLHGQIALRPLADAIKLFASGPYAGLLGANEDSLGGQNRLQVFEMATLMDLDPKVHLPVLLYLLDRIERDLDGRPTMIVLDEAGIALLHPVFASRIREWALTLRKKNACVILAIQALSQLSQNDSFSILLQSCPTKIFLPNENATSPALAHLYQACGLNETQIALIAGATKKRDYYLVGPDGCSIFNLALTPAELAFYSTLPGLSLNETHTAMRRAMAAHGTSWPAEWLRLCGLHEAADRLLKEIS
jgi:type IV secretion/conjugal transfer VirB4 family ATPase